MRCRVAILFLVSSCEDKAPAPAAPIIASTVAEDLAAMTDYIRKSKAAEAKVNVNAIARNIKSASQEEQIGPDGALKPFALTAAPLTPPIGECCKQPKGRCAPATGDWKHAGWQAIGYQLDDPHYYSYEIVVDDKGFIARAVGDLDCDGERATFELRGTLAPDGMYTTGELTSENPLE